MKKKMFFLLLWFDEEDGWMSKNTVNKEVKNDKNILKQRKMDMANLKIKKKSAKI